MGSRQVLATAKAQQWDAAEVPKVLLDEEIRGRGEATRAMRRKIASLPAEKKRPDHRPDRRLLAPMAGPGRVLSKRP